MLKIYNDYWFKYPEAEACYEFVEFLVDSRNNSLSTRGVGGSNVNNDQKKVLTRSGGFNYIWGYFDDDGNWINPKEPWWSFHCPMEPIEYLTKLDPMQSLSPRPTFRMRLLTYGESILAETGDPIEFYSEYDIYNSCEEIISAGINNDKKLGRDILVLEIIPNKSFTAGIHSVWPLDGTDYILGDEYPELLEIKQPYLDELIYALEKNEVIKANKEFKERLKHLKYTLLRGCRIGPIGNYHSLGDYAPYGAIALGVYSNQYVNAHPEQICNKDILIMESL